MHGYNTKQNDWNKHILDNIVNKNVMEKLCQIPLSFQLKKKEQINLRDFETSLSDLFQNYEKALLQLNSLSL